jgi:hypothetical protein
VNLYRSQFAVRPDRRFREETFHYTFDKTTVAALGVPITAGAVVNDIYLPFQPDAEFILRGIKVSTGSNLYLWLKDPFGNYLSQTYVPLSLYLEGAGAAIATGRVCIPVEPEIICPAGGNFVAYLANPSTGPLEPPAFTFFGVKRYCLENAA